MLCKVTENGWNPPSSDPLRETATLAAIQSYWNCTAVLQRNHLCLHAQTWDPQAKTPFYTSAWLSQGASAYWAAQFLNRATEHPIKLLKQLNISVLPTHLSRPLCLRDYTLVVEVKILLHFTSLIGSST